MVYTTVRLITLADTACWQQTAWRSGGHRYSSIGAVLLAAAVLVPAPN
jgi:hypothetical protein